MNQLSCQSCGSALEAEGFDRRLAVVHCSHCGGLFDLTKPRNTVNADGDNAKAQTAMVDNLQPLMGTDDEANRETASRPVAAMPQGFSTSGDEQHFKVRWSWRSGSSVLMLGFAVIWVLMVVQQFRMVGLDLFRGLFLLIGFGMLYRALASVINSTTITADEKWLTVRHSPLPWFPAPKIDASSIEQLFVSEGFTKTKKGKRIPFYYLNAVLRDNSLKRLSNKLSNIESALYLEQEFEKALHIRDRSVAGEVRGSTRNV